MTKQDAVKMVGWVVQGKDSDIFGILEYVTEDGWAGIRGPYNGLDEIQVERLQISGT